MRWIYLPVLLLLLLIGIGCDDSSEAPTSVVFPDGAQLLGITTDHTLHYRMFDSTIVFDPYRVVYDTTDLYVTFTGGSGNQVEMAINGTPQALLTNDNAGVLLSGQIRGDVIPIDTLLYIDPTPIVMPRSVTSGAQWSLSIPTLNLASGTERRTQLFLNYGFITDRRFIRNIDIVLPLGSYAAYQFESRLFLADVADTTPVMTVHEYYADGVGLVKLVASAPNYRRLIILLDDR